MTDVEEPQVEAYQYEIDNHYKKLDPDYQKQADSGVYTMKPGDENN